MEFVPPKEVFEIAPQLPEERVASGSYEIPGATGQAARSEDGEMLTIFEGFPLPRKTAVYREAVMANNEVKRRTLVTFAPFACKEMVLPALGFLLTPFKWKIRFLEKFLENYVREVDIVYYKCERIPYLKKEFYSNAAKGIWDVVSVFMQTLGFSENISEKIGKIFATLLEYDDLYRLMLIDPITDFTKEEILANPGKFVDKFLRLVKERDVQSNQLNKEHTGVKSITHKKFEDFGKLLKFALYHPKIRKAFKKAFEKVELRYLQLDEYEIFWNLGRLDYDLQGRGFKDRYWEYTVRIAEHIKEINKADEVQIRENDNGTYSIDPIFYEKTAPNANDSASNPLVEDSGQIPVS